MLKLMDECSQGRWGRCEQTIKLVSFTPGIDPVRCTMADPISLHSRADTSATLRADDVSVSFGAVRALDRVRFELRPGEIHSLCGENGAGKSTLIKCLGGAMRPTSGRILIGSAPLPARVRAAEDAGVAVIHQEPLAFPDLNAADTIFMAREPAALSGLWVHRAKMHCDARSLLASLGENVDTRRAVGSLPLAQRQMIAIARGLATNCRFLILDEPTASLSVREARTLHTLMRTLAAKGVGVLLVSHRLDEVLMLSHRVSVLRDGTYVGTRDVAVTVGALTENVAGNAGPLTRKELVRMMVGRDVAVDRAEEPGAGAHNAPGNRPPRLAVEHLTRHGVFRDISFQVHAGEIVGLGGLIGAGRSDVVRAIAGIEAPDEGRTLIDGVPLKGGSTSGAIRSGVVLVPEERREQGLVLAMSIAANIGMTSPPPRTSDGPLSRWGLVSRRAQRTLAQHSISRLSIKTPGLHTIAGALSGGNQQKVLLAKWLAHAPKVLILDEPTRGVDVGAKAEIHMLVRQLARDGAAVLVVSSDLPELLALSHRVIVMREGTVSGELSIEDATPDAVLSLAVPGGNAAGTLIDAARTPNRPGASA